MATYVNNLRLKEITTGDEDGTWGTSTNTNLELIADAFGYSTEQLAANANETFTMTDGTADGVRALYLKLTSAVSLSATRTVTLAPNTVSKVWIIENATTGGQSITISQGSGSTVTIANGTKAMVYTDGAGATAAVVLATPTIALASGVTGTLPIANGGTGTTSTTFVNLATNVTGTLPVANGGTGAATLTANNVILGNGTSAVQFVAPGSSGNVLTSDGTTWQSTTPAAGISLSADNTWTGTQTFSGTSAKFGVVLNDAAEVATVSATAATGTINYDITTQSVLYYTSNASANWTVNFRASSGTSLNTALATGQSATVAFLVTQGATAYYNSAVQVDGSSVTPKWQGGTAPTAGNASSIDAYVYTIIKTGSATFTVLASQTRFA